MNPQAVSLCIALVSVPAVLLGWTIAAHNARIWRVRQQARNLPAGTRERILALITEAARHSPACTLLVPVNSGGDESQEVRSNDADITASRFGGTPYGEAGDRWPILDDESLEPADFLIQVRLDDPLPTPWPGRLIAVFLRFDLTQTTLVYNAPSLAKYTRRTGGPESSPECPLIPVRIPTARSAGTPSSTEWAAHSETPAETSDSVNDWQLPYDPTLLIELVPQLNEELQPFTRRPVDLLAHLLLTARHGYELDVSDIVQMGGRPQWVQDDPGPMTCPECGQSLRFLFQFGDLSGQNRLGDAGVCYLFGCDAHPDSVQTLVQMC